MHQGNIDVIVPSFRLNDNYLIPIFELKQPENFTINFFLIADNPTVKISDKLKNCILNNHINLIVNDINLGFSKTRNKGIEAGNAPWILFLDDDIIPKEDLLISYAKAIVEHPESIGFIGVTNFPIPKNNVTKALVLNGLISSFTEALHKDELPWAPTANMMFNRSLLGKRRFLESLKNGGEDIELLSRNCIENNKKYLSVPDAVVTHPWWNDGKMQTKRMFQYGKSTGDIINVPHIKLYSSWGFTNTTETLLIILCLGLLLLPLTGLNYWVFKLSVLVLCAEILTNIFKSAMLSDSFSIPLSMQMFWHKNVYEAGFVWSCLKNGKYLNLAKRIDVNFKKPYPSSFRLNRWKILKMSLILFSSLLILFW